jgi:hypothetical protein
MGVKISALPAIAAPSLTDIFPVVQAGVTYKETCTQLAALIGSVATTTITGTANQVIASASVGPVTLSLPQSIATTSDVTFGSVTFSPTTKGIVGTPTNNNAAASYVGEFISSNIGIGTPVAVTSTVCVNITSISLTAGDWDVFGTVYTLPAAGTTTSAYSAAINTVSATLPGSGPNNAFVNFTNIAAAANLTLGFPVGSCRISLAGTTTVYLVTTLVFAVSTMGAYGWIGARRMR